MQDIANLLTNASPTVVIALIFWKIMAKAFAFHARSMAEQRKDLLAHMQTVCRGRHSDEQ